MKYLLLAGIYNSGPMHWQSLWQKADSRFMKLEHSSWDLPDRKLWVEELEQRVASLGADTVLVAHSLACLMLAHWAAQTSQRIAAAMLVSVPDPLGPSFPADAKHFDKLPLSKFGFPSAVVASENDPYGSVDHMFRCATAWGSKFIRLGRLGHINAESNLGDWPEGQAILKTLI